MNIREEFQAMLAHYSSLDYKHWSDEELLLSYCLNEDEAFMLLEKEKMTEEEFGDLPENKKDYTLLDKATMCNASASFYALYCALFLEELNNRYPE